MNKLNINCWMKYHIVPFPSMIIHSSIGQITVALESIDWFLQILSEFCFIILFNPSCHSPQDFALGSYQWDLIWGYHICMQSLVERDSLVKNTNLIMIYFFLYNQMLEYNVYNCNLCLYLWLIECFIWEVDCLRGADMHPL